MALSRRAEAVAVPSNSSLLSNILINLWDPQTNPNGIVSLGLAENTLMHKELLSHINSHLSLPANTCTYGDGFTGSRRTKSAVAHFLSARLHPLESILPAHITITNGCSSALEQLSWAIAGPGDALLLGRPYYTRLALDPSLRSSASIIPVSFGDLDPLHPDAIAAYEQAILRARATGIKVSGILLCNPHNPLGRCYPRKTLVALLGLCQKYQVHLISDEIYALSIWGETVEGDLTEDFVSCLSIAEKNIIDPSLVHVVWGISKDFGANGLRLGAVISQHNKPLHTAMLSTAIYSSVSAITDHITANLLEDSSWVSHFINEAHQRLRRNHSMVTTWADSKGLKYTAGVNAGLFVWLDLGSAFLARHPHIEPSDVESYLKAAFEQQSVHVASGAIFGSEQAGWYRLVFSVAPNVLQEGLTRIGRALDQAPNDDRDRRH